jgi:DNA recombination protein RmuC
VYYEAVVRGEDLAGEESIVGYALRRKVIPVSPNTFYAYLAAILHGLKGLEVEKEAREILDSLGGLQQQFARFDVAYRLVGKHLDHAVRQYDEAEKQIGLIQERFQKITGVKAGGGLQVAGGGESPIEASAADAAAPAP